MHDGNHAAQVRIARIVGASLLASIAIGIVASMTVSSGIDINLSADVELTARNMLEAEARLRGKAYVAALGFALEALVFVGFFLLLRDTGRLLATWSLVFTIAGAMTGLAGAVFMLNAAEIAGDRAYAAIATAADRLLLTGVQATSAYTSFHLGLVISTAGKAGFFYLFARSRLIPMVIAAWGVFASSFVVFVIVARDFVPALGNTALTLAFMVSNLVALLATGLYLAIRGVRLP